MSLKRIATLGKFKYCSCADQATTFMRWEMSRYPPCAQRLSVHAPAELRSACSDECWAVTLRSSSGGRRNLEMWSERHLTDGFESAGWDSAEFINFESSTPLGISRYVQWLTTAPLEGCDLSRTAVAGWIAPFALHSKSIQRACTKCEIRSRDRMVSTSPKFMKKNHDQIRQSVEILPQICEKRLK